MWLCPKAEYEVAGAWMQSRIAGALLKGRGYVGMRRQVCVAVRAVIRSHFNIRSSTYVT
jgi:hypothetical protein